MINEIIKGISKLTSSSQDPTPDITLLKFTIVNACLVGDRNGWVLVDAGLENSADFIVNAALEKFGSNKPPQAIILTHGHFDHVGSVIQLAELWDVPVYAHQLEIPYITGKKDYPLADPDADEGLVAKISPSFPHRAINLGYRAVALPEDGRIPGMKGWRWIHTPGHTEGHVCFNRDLDRTLIVGDAFTTVKQESSLSVLSQNEDIKGPPAYFTTDWDTAGKSIGKIRALRPELAIPSHGMPMKDDKLARHLDMLFLHFEGISVPEHSKSNNTFFNTKPPR